MNLRKDEKFVLKDLCHWCGGSGEDVDASGVASPDNCPNCHGTGIEPEEYEVECERCHSVDCECILI